MTYNKKIFDQQHQKTLLPNGLLILSKKNEHVSSIAIEAWVKVGSRYESEKENGIAHFIEHLNFKGTKKRTSKQIAEEFDAIGGYLNAYTSREHTVYSAKILKEFLPLTIDIFNDIMFNSTYNEEDIEKEKNVVLQELAQAFDNPEDLSFELFYADSFKDQAIGKSILGTEENINSFTKNDVVNFVQKFYTAPRIIISAAGNVDHEELVKLIKNNFFPFEEKSTPIPAVKAFYTGGYRFKLDQDLSQFHLLIGFKGISLESQDYYKQEMLANILGGSISSRLFQEIREKRGLVYSVGSFCQYYSDTGLFGISAATSIDKLNELIQVLGDEVKKTTFDLKQEELNRCLAQVKSALLMGRETVDNWVGILAGNYSYYGRYIPKEEIWEQYAKLTIEDIQLFAKEVFSQNKHITITAIGNKNILPSYEEILQLTTI